MGRWRLAGMRAIQSFLGNDSADENTDGVDWRKRQIAVVVVALVMAALFIALQMRIEAVVRENDLPKSCAMRGQPCPTTSTVGPTSAG